MINFNFLPGKKRWTRNRFAWLGIVGITALGIAGVYSLITSATIVIDNRPDWRALLGFAVAEKAEKTARQNFSKKNLGGWLDANFDWQGLNPSAYKAPDNIYPRGLNLLFIADEFSSFEEFKGAVDKILGVMKQTEPWKNHAEINAFLIYQNDPALCEVKEENLYAPVLKCGEGLIKLAQTLPIVKEKVIVVSREPFVSWANVSRLENSFVFYSMPQSKESDPFNLKIFLHEFAHGFGLRDETRTVIADSGSAPTRPEGPNCAPTVDVARLWWGGYLARAGDALTFNSTKNEVGFYFGCAGNQDYIRPTQKSLMNIQDFPDADSYGPVSEAYLKKVLNYCFSGKIYSEKDDPEFFKMYPDYKQCLKH